MAKLIIHRAQLTEAEQQLLQTHFGNRATAVAQHHRIELNETPSAEALSAIRALSDWDINCLPDSFEPNQIKLIISDMDSTLINIECIDEIGEHLGIKAQISHITEAAMRGELNFEQSLTKRVALLSGTPLSALEAVYQQRLALNEGAETLIQTCRNMCIKFALVSGGFTFFTDRLKTRLNLDYTRANVLGFDEHQQTNGTVIGSIVGAEAKREFLLELCDILDIGPNQAIAVGDGANDLCMMQEAGLSVAYHAKPTVQAAADTALNYRGLDAILDFFA